MDEKPTDSRIRTRDGTTSTGVYLKICVIYSSDMSDGSPDESTALARAEQSEFTDCILEDNSPELYCLKKSGGMESSLIMVADSIFSFKRVCTQPVIRFCPAETISILIFTHTIKTAIAARTDTFLLSSTGPKSRKVSLGTRKPTPILTSETPAIRMISAIRRHPRRYLARIGIDIFFCGNGR